MEFTFLAAPAGGLHASYVGADEQQKAETSSVSRDTTKPTTWLCAQRRLRSAWASAYSVQGLCWPLEEPWSLTTSWAHSEDSDQTERMPRLILVSAGRTLSLLVLSCRSSNYSSSGPFLAVMLFGRNHCSSKTTTVISKCEVTWDNNWATSRETLSSGVCDLVRLKPACAVTEAS